MGNDDDIVYTIGTGMETTWTASSHHYNKQ